MTAPDAFAQLDPSAERSRRSYSALNHLATRHADTPQRRARQVHPLVVSPHEAVRLVVVLAGGTAQPEAGEPEIDRTDIAAALTLVADARAEMDAVELGLLRIARGRGSTWQEIAFGLGLGTAQAARQRFERLEARTNPEPAETAPGGPPNPEPG